ncbi:PIN domain-containing protein [Paenibacillus tepidiphilus]|uniref:PIN domain-containing protein n=1 Tax=Paenibacillus tepidiphilus TaxID=2608683 RepID=UPI001239231F|nr:PIN domain-containing protein [Paenibacillus tepidiphilus]
MNLINFNNHFKGFENEESILIDTGVLYAYYNEYDAYYDTIRDLFDTYVFGNEDVLFLFVNPTIVNEISNLAQNPLDQFLKAFPTEASKFNQSDKIATRDTIMRGIYDLIQQGVLNILDGDKDSVLKQIEITNNLGAADAVNASLAHLYGISFLTVDHKLVNNINTIQGQLSNIRNIYYTTGRHRAYQ